MKKKEENVKINVNKQEELEQEITLDEDVEEVEESEDNEDDDLVFKDSIDGDEIEEDEEDSDEEDDDEKDDWEDDEEESQKKRKKSSAKGLWQVIFGCALGVLIMVCVLYKPWEKLSDVFSGSNDPLKCVELGKYDGLDVSLVVTDEDVQLEIESLQEENTKYEQKQGTVQDGDMVYAKFDAYLNGEFSEDLSDEDYVEIGVGDFPEDFESAFIGAETGKEFDFTMIMPEGTYDDDKIDGKEIDFKATVQYICGEEIVPEYNDAFVASVTEYKTTAEYEEATKQQLLQEYKDEKEEYAWSEVLENSKVKKYPKDQVEEAKKQTLQDYYDMADLYGYSHDEIFQAFGMADEKEFVDTELESLAKDTVKEVLVIKAIAAKENISYTKEEYATILDEEYSYYTDSYDSKEAYEKENKESIEEYALTSAVKKWISEHANFEIEIR